MPPTRSRRVAPAAPPLPPRSFLPFPIIFSHLSPRPVLQGARRRCRLQARRTQPRDPLLRPGYGPERAAAPGSLCPAPDSSVLEASRRDAAGLHEDDDHSSHLSSPGFRAHRLWWSGGCGVAGVEGEVGCDGGGYLGWRRRASRRRRGEPLGRVGERLSRSSTRAGLRRAALPTAVGSVYLRAPSVLHLQARHLQGM